MKNFDLNIDKILENWDVYHAIRELISNAIDESILTRTSPPQIFKDAENWWHIKDQGRGLRYSDLIQSENKEKISNPLVIGKFGIGLKDALATFERCGVKILIKSRHGDISLSRVSKHSFEEIVTLHATVAPPSQVNLVGTDCCLYGVNDSEIEAAKNLFLIFSTSGPIEKTPYGEILQKSNSSAYIYINGLKVAEEARFLFSYNITSINKTIKKSLNRERQNLARGAYADRVRAILLASNSREIKFKLANEITGFSKGSAHDEMNWAEVQVHAARVLSTEKKDNVVFATANELTTQRDLVDQCESSGKTIVVVPDNLSEKLRGTCDFEDQPVNTLEEHAKSRAASFEFKWVDPCELTMEEAQNWQQCDRILSFIGGRPANVRQILISETMQKDFIDSTRRTVGLWIESEGRIVIKRTQLAALDSFAGTLLHEAIHAKDGVSDVSREFESILTRLAGKLAAKVLGGV
jgi:hypothetical protein